MLTLTLLLGTIIASVPPVKASSSVKIYLKPEFPSYHPGVTATETFVVEMWIESPPGWENTADGIVGWSIYMHVDPAVLMPYDFAGADPGYFLRDFIDDYGYPIKHRPKILLGDVNASHFMDLAEYIQGWETIGVGAGGSGLLCNLTLRSKSDTAYSLIDLYDVYYYTPAGMFEADMVVDGHYNLYTGFSFLHSTSSLIDLSDPETTSWQELYPTYGTAYDLNDWVDSDSDGNLSYCDYIKLNETWYHVVRVTVTLLLYERAGGKTYYRFLESTGWEEYYDVAIADPRNVTWHEVYSNWTGGGPDPTHEFCRAQNIIDWSDEDTSGDVSVDDIITVDIDPGPGPDWDVVDVSTDIIVTPEEPPAVPEFPLGAALEIGLIVAITYVWWRSRRKTKITKQAKLAY